MKRVAAVVLTGVFLAGLLAACAVEQTDELIISIASSDFYETEQSILRVHLFSSISFSLFLKDNYELDSLDYLGNYKIAKGDNGLYTITLYQVKRSQILHPNCFLSDNIIYVRYDANGGNIKQGAETNVRYSTEVHKRPNSSQGIDLFEREGYVLVGWNTKSDLTGEHISLGSRFTPTDTLYAEWEQESPAEDFSFSVEDNEAFVSCYSGQQDCVVIPSNYNGIPVTGILSGAFTSKTLKKVVLPTTVKTIESDAFICPALTEVTIFDSVETLGDTSFQGCENLSTVYINAIEAPVFTKGRTAVYADKTDLLYLHPEKKLVFYSGCSTWFNLDSEIVAEAFPEYYPINMGINGYYSGICQIRILSTLMSEGDILVHTPEENSEEQLLISTDMTVTMWECVELNYDLISQIDIRGIDGFFDTFEDFISVRKKCSAGKYTDVDLLCGEHGDYPDEQLAEGDNANLEQSASIISTFLSDASLENRSQEYERFISQGIKVFVGFSAVNLTAVGEDRAEWLRYENRVKEHLTVPVISRVCDYVFDGKYFSVTNYHLATEYRSLFTNAIICDLMEAL